jgi:hypothetical protein
MMDLQVSLPQFIHTLEEAMTFDSRYPQFDQTGWLLSHWSFEDTTARYDALPLLANHGSKLWKRLRAGCPAKGAR